MILGGNVISLTLLKNPQKMKEYIYESLFLYRALNLKRGLPEKYVNQVLPCKNVESIKLGNLNTDVAWFWLAPYTTDILALCLICQLLKPKIVFEIGTLHGYSAFHFALNTPDDAIIYTLDLPKDKTIYPKLNITPNDYTHIIEHQRPQKYFFEDSEVASKIHCLFGDSADFDFSKFYGKVDFFYIDGAHSYEYVKSDTLSALKCCHKGSVIAWDDFGRVGLNGVSEYLLELSQDHEIYVVPGGSTAFMVVKGADDQGSR
jgi:predicted O-methyltransferase YrrM